MADVIQLNHFRQTAVAARETEQQPVQRDPWLADFLSGMQEDTASADLHYMCANRGTVMRAADVIREIEAVIPKPPAVTDLNDPYAEARREILNIPMRKLIEEITHSSHVTWLSLPYHYAAIVTEFYRRWDAYDRLVQKLNRQ